MFIFDKLKQVLGIELKAKINTATDNAIIGNNNTIVHQETKPKIKLLTPSEFAILNYISNCESGSAILCDTMSNMVLLDPDRGLPNMEIDGRAWRQLKQTGCIIPDEGDTWSITSAGLEALMLE
jgi:hypothetical protein